MSTSVSLWPAGEPASRADPLRLAAAAYLARFTGPSRAHTESDLRIFLAWCAERGVDPLAAGRAQVELYVRWMQEIRRLKPSTVSRRMSVVAGFYRTCVIDGMLEHSPAEHVRRPPVPAESPTLGLTHLQLEALLSAARDSGNPYDFALVCLLGLLGLRIFEACGANIEDLGGGRATGPLLLNRYGSRMDRQAATRRLAALAQTSRMRMPRLHPHMLRHTFVTTMLDAGVDLRDVQIAARHADPARRRGTTGPATSSTGTRTTSSPPTWPPAPDRPLGRQDHPSRQPLITRPCRIAGVA